MTMILKLFRDDVKRITSNVVSLIIVVGLVVLPSIFSWYNVLACWDVFDNTDNLKVAVANNDEGYQSDLVPLKINMGEQVLSSLLDDKEMNWVFTDEQDAVDGAKSGKYYAAVVIPPTFSKDMMTFYSPDVEHAKLLYYTNDKKNVVAPKLTQQGADDAAGRINDIFVEKISEIGLNVASQLVDYSDKNGVASKLGQLAQNIDSMSSRLTQTSQVVSGYGAILDSTKGVISGTADLLKASGASADGVVQSANESKDALSSLSGVLSSSNAALGDALSQSAEGYSGVSEAIDTAFASAGNASATSADALDNQSVAIAGQAQQYRALAQSIGALSVPAEYQSTLDALVEQLTSSADAQQQLADSLSNAAELIRSNNAQVQEKHQEVSDLAAQAKQSVSDLSQDFNSSIRPQLDDLQSRVSSGADSLLQNAASLASLGDDMAGSSESMLDTLDQTQSQLQRTAEHLNESAQDMHDLSVALTYALSSGDADQLRQILGSDPSHLAASLASPVSVERNAVFPAQNFGAQMAPLYTMVGLWIGSLLLAVAIKVVVSKRSMEAVGYPKFHQVFLGRFLIFALLSFLQSTLLGLGNLFFLQLTVAEPLLFMLVYWIAGLVFTFIIYTLVVSFANLGKAIAVLILIFQITAGGGSYPLPTLPDFIQALSPLMPATHAINALRAAMMGVYQGDIWFELGYLLLFLIPFVLLGLVLRKPLIRLVNWYLNKVEESKLVS
ncbi:MAG: YhgE/Pip family protein [Eggerthellaceae bacterium]